jgi:spore coat-associated protein N
MQATETRMGRRAVRADRSRKGSRRRVLLIGGLVLATVVLASAFLVGSGAVFTSSSANPSNVFTAGTFTQTNSKDGAAIATFANMKPGDVATGSVTIQNTGSLAGDFILSMVKTGDTAGTGGGHLYDVLQLTVMDGTNEVYVGALNAFTTRAAVLYAAGASHTYDFTVTFPSASGNTYQASSATVEFDWNATQH